jgi:hypothetical protein
MIKKLLLTVALGFTAITTSSMAQESSNRVAVETDWSVFEETNPRQCWAVTVPKETENTKNGKLVEVRRGDIFLYVFFSPDESKQGLVAFTGGYPFAKGEPLKLEMDGERYELATEDDWAWPPTPADDTVIISAMKRGAQAVITGQSGRGTVTKDTFSLLGFTVAVKEAEKRCSG